MSIQFLRPVFRSTSVSLGLHVLAGSWVNILDGNDIVVCRVFPAAEDKTKEDLFRRADAVVDIINN